MPCSRPWGATVFLRLARELGLRLVGTGPDSKGWWKCRAIDREDADPSASFHGDTGYYFDHGGSETRLSILDLAMKLSGSEYPDLCTTLDKLGDRFIGTLPRRGAGRAPAAAPDTTADHEPVAEPGGVEAVATSSAAPAVDVADVRHRVQGARRRQGPDPALRGHPAPGRPGPGRGGPTRPRSPG